MAESSKSAKTSVALESTTIMKATTQLERLLKQRAELDKAIENTQKEASQELRERDKQRKIIFGAWCMTHRPELLLEFIEHGLVRAQDKIAFHNWLPPKKVIHEKE